jgi:Xaa-Pro aminopeptidase
MNYAEVKVERNAIFQERVGKVAEALKKSEMDAVLLNKPWNVSYLTGGINPCSWVFITKKNEQVALIWESDADAYKEESIIKDLRFFRDFAPFQMFRSVAEELGLAHAKIGLELGRPGLSHPNVALLKASFPPGVEFMNGETLLEEIRAIKSQDEIEKIKKAVEVVELGMKTAIHTIKPGVKESDVVLEAEYAIRKAGGRIPTMCYAASGKRSGLSHQFPSQKIIANGDVIVLDIHGSFGGYCADMARTVSCGKVDKEIHQAYAHLLRAEEAIIQLCREGTKMTEIRKVFYRELGQAKGLKFLIGSPLHGIGVTPSELPTLTHPHHEKGFPEILAANMVVAISGIGLFSKQGWGVRAEDMILVDEKNPTYLTNYTRELISI